MEIAEETINKSKQPNDCILTEEDINILASLTLDLITEELANENKE